MNTKNGNTRIRSVKENMSNIFVNIKKNVIEYP